MAWLSFASARIGGNQHDTSAHSRQLHWQLAGSAQDGLAPLKVPAQAGIGKEASKTANVVVTTFIETCIQCQVLSPFCTVWCMPAMLHGVCCLDFSFALTFRKIFGGTSLSPVFSVRCFRGSFAAHTVGACVPSALAEAVGCAALRCFFQLLHCSQFLLSLSLSRSRSFSYQGRR